MPNYFENIEKIIISNDKNRDCEVETPNMPIYSIIKSTGSSIIIADDKNDIEKINKKYYNNGLLKQTIRVFRKIQKK